MLAKNAKERAASMRECIDALDAALNDTLSYDFETAEPPREAPPRERTPEQGPAGRVPVKAVSASPARLTPGVIDGQALWEELRQSAHPARTRLEPMRSGTPRVLLLLAGLEARARRVRALTRSEEHTS